VLPHQGVFGVDSGAGGSEDDWDEIEGTLYSADLGPKIVSELINDLKHHLSRDSEAQDAKAILKNILLDKFRPLHAALLDEEKTDLDWPYRQLNSQEFNQNFSDELQVVMIVGVNGAGKTTTIGKLATKWADAGLDIVVGACDTFRAAAVDQLEVWCQRANVPMIRAKEGSHPSAVGYQTLQAAQQEKKQICLLDTAGRLHTKENLMDELVKSRDVLKKLAPKAPQHIWLVIDAITGQNALKQAEEFHKYLNLTGLIFTKCDGSSKAGCAVAIVDQLKLPILYLGVGETAADLNQFDPKVFVEGLVGR